MSAFAQHDEMNPVVVESETECRLCSFPILVFLPYGNTNLDEEHLVGAHQLVPGAPTDLCDPTRIQDVCERCWWKAWHNAKPENVLYVDGINIIYGVPVTVTS